MTGTKITDISDAETTKALLGLEELPTVVSSQQQLYWRYRRAQGSSW